MENNSLNGDEPSEHEGLETNEFTEWHEIEVKNASTGEQEKISIVCGHSLTDIGLKDRLIDLFGDNIRYCVNEKTWYIYNELANNGGLWDIDRKNKINALAEEVTNLILAEVAFVKPDQDGDLRKAQRKLSDFAFKSMSRRSLEAMVSRAESDQRTAITSDEFNKNPYLFNCLNGTLDLEKGELRKADRSDLLTNIASVEYDREASSGAWYVSLNEALNYKQALFLQRACGSALTGINRDKALFVLYGKPNARKSTLLDSIFNVMGTYAAPVDISTFAKHMQKAGGARPDIIALEHVRAAQCSEVPRGMAFNDAFLKSITSANPRSARDNYEKGMHKITPITKFFIETNFLPEVSGDDEAAFNRFFIISFLNDIPLAECNPLIKEFLIEDKETQKAILAWLVEGCYDWLDLCSLAAPPEVDMAREDYKRAMNPLSAFIDGCCIFEEGAFTSTSELFEVFKLDASAEERHAVPNISEFGKQLTKLQIKSKHTSTGNLRENIRLRGLNEFDEIDAVDINQVDQTEQNASMDGKYEGNEGNEGGLQHFPCNAIEYRKTYTNYLHSLHTLHYKEKVNSIETLEDDLNELVDRIDEL